MQVLCAWCLRDGKSAHMGEREPLENPEPTHGVCPGHLERLLEAFPSRSFPCADLFIIVRRNGTLFERLSQSFAGVPGVKVFVDRRKGERRSATQPVTKERRRAETRRVRQGTLSTLGGFTIVRFTPKTVIPPLTLEHQRSTSRSEPLHGRVV